MEGSSSPVTAPVNSKVVSLLSLEILHETKTSQNQHGLRHNDYQRYRQYCSKRLRRIRKSLGFTHGKTKFQKKTIDPEAVNNVRFLLLVLVKAERAWSYAMYMKDDAASNLRIRVHMTKKLAKAAKHAKELLNLCNLKADKKTILEAEAYSSWMTANYLLEKESWTESLKEYSKAKTIYEQLGKVGTPEYLELTKLKLEEIEPSVRFCNYNLKHKKTQESDLIDMKLESSGPGMELLQAKLDAVISDSLKKQAETMKEIQWRNLRIPIKNEKVRVHILTAQETSIELERADSYDKKMALFDKLFVSYNDATRVIKDELAAISAKKGQKDQEEPLNQLRNYITYLKLTKTIEKNMLLADSLEKKLSEESDTAKGKKTKPEDLVRAYEILFQNTQELSNTESSDPEKAKDAATKIVSFKALRCFYLSLSYLYGNKFNESLALLDRAAEQTRLAIQHHELCANPSHDFITKLAGIENKIRATRCEIHAKNFMETIAKEKQATSTPSNNNDNAQTEEGPQSLLTKINTFDYSFASSKQLIAFPPALEPAKCKPLLFDLAFSQVEFPSLEERKKAKGGWLSSFWR